MKKDIEKEEIKMKVNKEVKKQLTKEVKNDEVEKIEEIREEAKKKVIKAKDEKASNELVEKKKEVSKELKRANTKEESKDSNKEQMRNLHKEAVIEQELRILQESVSDTNQDINNKEIEKESITDESQKECKIKQGTNLTSSKEQVQKEAESDISIKKKIENELFASRKRSQLVDEPEHIQQDNTPYKVIEEPEVTYSIKEEQESSKEQLIIENSELIQQALEKRILENTDMRKLIERQVQEEIRKLKIKESLNEQVDLIDGSKSSSEELEKKDLIELTKEKAQLEYLETQRLEYEMKYKQPLAERLKFEEKQKLLQKTSIELDRREKLLLKKQRAQEEIRRKFQSDFFSGVGPLGVPPKEVESQGRIMNTYEQSDDIKDDCSFEPYRFNNTNSKNNIENIQIFDNPIHEYNKDIKKTTEGVMKIPNLSHNKLKERTSISKSICIPLLCLNYPEGNGTYGLLYAEVNDYDKVIQVKSIIAKELLVYPKTIHLYHKGHELADEVVISKLQCEGEILCFSVVTQQKKEKTEFCFEK